MMKISPASLAALLCCGLHVGLIAVADAAPLASPWPSSFGPSASIAAVAGSTLSGYEAAADSVSDSIEIRDTRGTLLASLSRARMTALVPWMTLDSSVDGPVSLAFSESGRLLFIALHTTSASPDASPADAILRYDTQTDSLSLFARLNLTPPDAAFTHLGMVHYRGRLYVASAGTIRCYLAGRDHVTGPLSFISPIEGGFTPTALVIDRTQSRILGAWNSEIWRASIAAGSLSFSSLGTLGNVRDLAFSDHYGGAASAGLYALSSSASNSVTMFIPLAQARATQPFAPTAYLGPAGPMTSLAALGDGSLLRAGGPTVSKLRDSSDTRLSFESWIHDEIAQVVNFGKGLVSPDGEPAGWVIDGDVIPEWDRFHPASPDAAAWTTLLCLMSDHLSGTSDNLPVVRSILTRYAGLKPDGIKPDRSADGIYQHWIDPATGNAEWTDGYATLSTMKIVHAAAKAAMFYPGDPEVRAAATAIIGGVKNWDSYLNASTGALSLLAEPTGGPADAAVSQCYNEGIVFVNAAATYGGPTSQLALARWLNRSLWPTGTYVTGYPVTTDSPNSSQAAFTNLYAMLLVDGYRNSPEWRTQIRNLRLSNYAWTDEFAPRWNTVFSAGTTRNGYFPDSVGTHPDNNTTFTSLEAFAAWDGPGVTHIPAATGAYHAYRIGARQTFKSGASILYRRSSIYLTWNPDSAGLPDVALGALGLAELVRTGSVESVIAGPLLNLGSCAADFNNDGLVDDSDFVLFAAKYNELLVPGVYRPGDLNGDSLCDDSDFVIFVGAYNDLLCN